MDFASEACAARMGDNAGCGMWGAVRGCATSFVSVNVPRTVLAKPLLAVTILLACGTTAAAEWVRVESPNFVVFGEIGEKKTREYAAEFERFREALGRVVPGAAARPPAPAMVFIFRNPESFAAYRPSYNGKPVQVAGYFAGGPDLDVIMLAATNRDDALRTIYHEYSHLVTVNMVRGLPVWLGEGLAEYYSTFQVREDGRQALLGGIVPGHLLRLNQERLLPLEELLAVEHDSPLYNEGSRRSTFYAQSWALVHLLLNGEPNRSAQFNEYVRRTAAGESSLDAWNAIFGKEKILEELRRYVRQAQVKGYLFRFNREIETTTFTVSTPAPADIHAALGELRFHVARETAVAHMDRSPAPPTAFTQAVRGLIKLDANDERGALALLVEATRESDDWLVQYRAAVALERIATAAPGEASREAGQAADAALRRVLERKPDLPHAIALRGLIEGPSDQGLALVKRARELAPGRPHYAIWQAQFHSARGEFAQARQILAPMLSPRLPKETRDYARTAMSEAVTAQQARERAGQHFAAGPAPNGHRNAAASGVVVPLYREVRPGEQRVDASFERIECPRSGIVLHVRIAGRAARFSAASLDAIEFLTFRADRTRPVQCGPREPPERIYLTFRPSTEAKNIEGIATAVEFQPQTSADKH